MKNSQSAKFITLTYNDENVPYVLNKETGELTHTLNKKDFQLFMKKFRKLNLNRKLKYYTCGEYGTETNRPHYHSIMFNMDSYGLQKLEETWEKGNVKIDPCNMATIRYVTKYITKKSYYKPSLDEIKKPEFSLMSKGMGISYLTPQMENHLKQHKNGLITHKDGTLQALPRYFKEKVFTKQERQQIAKEGKDLAEKQKEKKYKDAYHEVIYKKDQYRKIEKQEKLKRKTI